jgi:hypothetical protein
LLQFFGPVFVGLGEFSGNFGGFWRNFGVVTLGFETLSPPSHMCYVLSLSKYRCLMAVFVGCVAVLRRCLMTVFDDCDDYVLVAVLSAALLTIFEYDSSDGRVCVCPDFLTT